MKISNDEVIRALLMQKAPTNDQVNSPVKQVLPGENLKLSSAAKTIQKVKRQIDEMPDVREEYVEELKRKIAAGEYNVSDEEIADLMIRRSLADNIR